MATQEQVKNFIETLSKLAIAERNKRSKWVLPSVCIAQAALETGWGTSSLMTKANAYFGIKATGSWTGKVYSGKTQECYDGVNYTSIKDTFRAYDSIEESVSDYFDLITKSTRYAGAVNNANAESAITAIKQGGYATSPTYVANVMSIINTYNLTQYDTARTSGNADTSSTTAGTDMKKTIEQLAQEVITGKWGDGTERISALTNAGYDYDAVQTRVNELLGVESKSTAQQVTDTFAVGDKVKVTNAVTYDGVAFALYYSSYDVIQVNGDRIVIGIGNTVTAAVKAANLSKTSDTDSTPATAAEQQSGFKVNDKVKVVNAVDYYGNAFRCWYDTYTVQEVKNDRVVIGIDGTVTAAVNVANLAAA